MKVYAVEQGSYSDYRVEAIFNLEVDANTLVAHLNQGEEAGSYDEASVAEWELLDAVPEMWTRYSKTFSLNPDGTESHEREFERQQNYYGTKMPGDRDGGARVSMWNVEERGQSGGDGRYYRAAHVAVSVSATDHQALGQAESDARAKLKHNVDTTGQVMPNAEKYETREIL